MVKRALLATGLLALVAGAVTYAVVDHIIRDAFNDLYA